jgi:hypothetical protein
MRLKEAPVWKPATHYTRTIETVFEAPPETVSPFFCPVREYDFMRHWTCTMRHSVSGLAENRAIFQSGYPLPPGMKGTWICTRHEPDKAVSYTVFIQGAMIITLDNTFEPLPDGKTRHRVELHLFGLTRFGKIMAKAMGTSEKRMKKSVGFIGELEYYLKNNRKMP